MSFLMAVVIVVVGLIPLLLLRRTKAALVTGGIVLLPTWWLCYAATPSLVWGVPWSILSVLVVACWLVNSIICSHIAVHDLDWGDPKHPLNYLHHAWWFVGVGLLAFGIRGCSGWSAWRAHEYAALIGEIEMREWTQDVQPADPRHIRQVSNELACFLADKQLGNAPGAIGSQFRVSTDHMTLQMIRGELWYVAPLDYKGFNVWTSAKSCPGYVMVHGEDPSHPVSVKTDLAFTYMPGAFFSDNLERHLWANGYLTRGLTDYTFEVDEEDNPWWVVTVYEPSIAWWGTKVTGVVIVNPTDGKHDFYPLGKVPEWVDRAIPADVVEEWITNRGVYAQGWWNSFWTQQNITVPEDPNIIYGHDGQPYWVTGITSANFNDQSLVGLMYTHCRTGKSTFYHAVGGTDQAVLTSVNNQVKYKNWHGASPVLYNLYGTMASIVPLQGTNNTFQGVAIVRVDSLQVAMGDDQSQALREYQKLLATSAQQIAPESSHQTERLQGVVDRSAKEIRGGETTYYLHIENVPHAFTGGPTLSTKLPLTQPGDTVVIGFIASPEDVIPILSFDNTSLALQSSQPQQEVQQRVAERQAETAKQREVKPLRAELDQLSEEELRELLKLRASSKKQ